jgi:hypothetical protein
MTRRVITFSQNPKLECPDLWFSGEKVGFEKKHVCNLSSVNAFGFFDTFMAYSYKPHLKLA